MSVNFNLPVLIISTTERSGFELLGALDSGVDCSKLDTALKVVDAFSKVEMLIADIKKLAPELHKTLHVSISDITATFEDIIDQIGHAVDPNSH